MHVTGLFLALLRNNWNLHPYSHGLWPLGCHLQASPLHDYHEQDKVKSPHPGSLGWWGCPYLFSVLYDNQFALLWPQWNWLLLLDCKKVQPVHSEGDQPWDFFGRNDAKAETPVLWPPQAKSWLIWKDSDDGRDWGQEEKGTTEDEKAGWHHWLDGYESEWTPGVGDGQGGLACCDSWGRKESDMTEQLNWTDCDIFPLLKVACTDTYVTGVLVVANSGIVALVTSVLLFGSYVIILFTLRSHSAEGRHKALSTCGSHITVVVLFFGQSIFAYLRHPTTFPEDKLFSLFYTITAPVFNPLIYTLRNTEMKKVIRRVWYQKMFSEEKYN